MADENLTEQPSKRHVLQRDQSTLDLQALMEMPQFSRFVIDLLSHCKVFRNAYGGGSDATNFTLGEQNVGLWLIHQMNAIDPTAYPRILLQKAIADRDKKGTVNVLDDEE